MNENKNYTLVATTRGGLQIDSVATTQIREMYSQSIRNARNVRESIAERFRHADFMIDRCRGCHDHDNTHALRWLAVMELEDLLRESRNCCRRDRLAVQPWVERAEALLAECGYWEESLIGRQQE